MYKHASNMEAGGLLITMYMNTSTYRKQDGSVTMSNCSHSISVDAIVLEIYGLSLLIGIN